MQTERLFTDSGGVRRPGIGPPRTPVPILQINVLPRLTLPHRHADLSAHRMQPCPRFLVPGIRMQPHQRRLENILRRARGHCTRRCGCRRCRAFAGQRRGPRPLQDGAYKAQRNAGRPGNLGHVAGRILAVPPHGRYQFFAGVKPACGQFPAAWLRAGCILRVPRYWHAWHPCPRGSQATSVEVGSTVAPSDMAGVLAGLNGCTALR